MVPELIELSSKLYVDSAIGSSHCYIKPHKLPGSTFYGNSFHCY